MRLCAILDCQSAGLKETALPPPFLPPIKLGRPNGIHRNELSIREGCGERRRKAALPKKSVITARHACSLAVINVINLLTAAASYHFHKIL